jgi:hypothetical protein
MLYAPPGIFVGHDALDKFAGGLRVTHPATAKSRLFVFTSTCRSHEALANSADDALCRYCSAAGVSAGANRSENVAALSSPCAVNEAGISAWSPTEATATSKMAESITVRIPASYGGYFPGAAWDGFVSGPFRGPRETVSFNAL